MKYGLFLIFISFCLSCGNKHKGDPTGSYTVTSEGTPYVYKMSSRECTFDYVSKNPSTTSFYSGVYNDVILSNLSKRTIDESITLGGEYEINIGRVSTLETLKNPFKFNYCIDKAVIKKRLYFENAAISVLYPIREFNKKYDSLVWHLDIPDIKIQILPKYSRIKTTKVKRKKIRNKSYLINNAMYFGSKDTLIFLPQGSHKNTRLPFGGVPLWKSPAVVMHEYAHHVFRHLVVKNNKSIRGFGDTGLCMDNRELTSTTQATTARTIRDERTKEDALEAVNEGFADLFAYYSAGEKTFFKEMGCMEKTRDIQSELFLSQEKKSFSKSALTEFLDINKNASRGCDISVDHQDPHMVGAIMAHGFYKLLESTGMTPYYKLQVILLWLRDVRAIYDESSNPEELFKLSIESFYSRVNDFTGKLKLNCNGYKETFSFTDINC